MYYNTERPHHGYRNMGKRPSDTVAQYLKARERRPCRPNSATKWCGV